MIQKIIIISFIFATSIFSQVDSLQEAFKYYPLHIGDYWEYQVEKSGVFPSDSANWIAHSEIVGDTILENNFKYFVALENGMDSHNKDYNYFKFIRIDSSNGNVYLKENYQDEILIDSLLMKIGDQLQNIGLSDIYYKNVFGFNTKVRFMEQSIISTSGWYNYELAKNFGKIHTVIAQTDVYEIDFKYDLVYACINNVEYGVKTDVVDNLLLNEKYSLSQNYPNPFNPTTNIVYHLPKKSYINISIYNVIGAKVLTLVKGNKNKGIYEIQFDGSKLSSGVYYYVLDYGDSRISKKMMLIK